MFTHQAQNRVKIANPHISAILRAKCKQEKNDIQYCFEFYGISAFQRTFDDQNQTKNSLLYDILQFDENFFLDPYFTENFRKWGVTGVIFRVRVQSLNKHTEASFCPILIIESALES